MSQIVLSPLPLSSRRSSRFLFHAARLLAAQQGEQRGSASDLRNSRSALRGLSRRKARKARVNDASSLSLLCTLVSLIYSFQTLSTVAVDRAGACLRLLAPPSPCSTSSIPLRLFPRFRTTACLALAEHPQPTPRYSSKSRLGCRRSSRRSAPKARSRAKRAAASAWIRGPVATKRMERERAERRTAATERRRQQGSGGSRTWFVFWPASRSCHPDFSLTLFHFQHRISTAMGAARRGLARTTGPSKDRRRFKTVRFFPLLACLPRLSLVQINSEMEFICRERQGHRRTGSTVSPPPRLQLSDRTELLTFRPGQLRRH